MLPAGFSVGAFSARCKTKSKSFRVYILNGMGYTVRSKGEICFQKCEQLGKAAAAFAVCFFFFLSETHFLIMFAGENFAN